jgi:hypothetical protein
MTVSLKAILILCLSLPFANAFGYLNTVQVPTMQMPIATWSGLDGPFEGLNLVNPKDCEKSYNGTQPGEPFSYYCQPDTLYSWTEPSAVDLRIKSLKDSNWGGSWNPLFLTRAPISTFAYGSVSIRIKLKKGVKFKIETSHCEVSAAEAETTVYATNFIVREFLICSPKVIESISYGTKNHYDEIIRDYKQHVTNPQKASFYFYESDDIFKTSTIDGRVFSKEKIIANMRKHLSLIENKDSFIIFNPSSATELQTQKEHFLTEHPIYFHTTNED